MSGEGSGHKGLTAQSVVDAATALTRERGLTGWSMRDLSGSLGVAPSAIYHHVGDREDVIGRVVGGLAADFEPADPGLDWQAWFEQTLLGIRATLRGHPGVAHWFMMHGPSLPEASAIADAGIAVLQRAGFADRVGFAYAVMFNQVVGSVAFGDDRGVVGADGNRAYASLLVRLSEQAGTSPGVAELVRTLVLPMVTDPRAEERFVRDALRATMRGLAAELVQGSSPD